MNILYHHRTLADGAEGIHIHEMVAAFRSLGHDVTLGAIARSASAGQGHSGLLASVRRRLPQLLFEGATAVLNVPEYLRTRRQLDSRRYDLVYSRHALLDLGTLEAARGRGVPVVLEANVAYSAPSMRRFEPVRLLRAVRAAERRALLSSTLVIAVSSPLAAYLRELGGPSVNILTLPNGVNPALFDPARADRDGVRARLGLRDSFVVGWAGVLRRWHGIEVLIDAVAGLPGVHLLLIGDGPDRPFIEALARERGLADRLTITGRLPHDSMPHYLAAIDSAVAAADRTGFASPMKVVEYMAMGRAVALPRLSNLADLVEDGRTGVFFTPDDAADLAQVIAQLQASRPRREALGRAAREEVERRLNWRQNAIAVLDAVAGAAPAAVSGR